MISRLRPRALVGLALATTAALAACGDSGLPAVKFVGNETCPTKGASPKAPSPPNVNSLPPVGQAVDEMPATHVEPPAIVKYLHDPPASGCHYSNDQAPIKPGAYNQAIPPEYWVHNLEHGYVIVLYNCPQGCSQQFQQLRTWYHSLPPDSVTGYAKVVILPWPSMSVPFAAVSWDWYDPIPNFSIAEVQRFYANHVNQAQEPNSA